MPEAVVIVERARRENWPQAVAKQATETLGDELWERFEAQSRRTRSLCDPLAEAAREILKIHATVGAVERLAVGAAEAADPPRLVVEIVSALASAHLGLVVLLHARLERIAHALRILGIFVCALFGDLNNCACLHDLAADTTKQQFQASLWQFLSTT